LGNLKRCDDPIRKRIKYDKSISNETINE
jgi:hypothetical protein